MKFEVGDYIRFDVTNHPIKYIGQIHKIENGFYLFTILLSNKPIPLNRRKAFQIGGKMEKYVEKITEEEFNEYKTTFRFS